MLSHTEEQDMHIARGGGGPVADNFLYPEEDEPPLTEALHNSEDYLPDEQEARTRGPIPHFLPELLMNHRDPMLDSDLMRPLGFPYSPHDPVIGSYDTHDPGFSGPKTHSSRS